MGILPGDGEDSGGQRQTRLLGEHVCVGTRVCELQAMLRPSKALPKTQRVEGGCERGGWKQMTAQLGTDKKRPFTSKAKVNDILTVPEDSQLRLRTDPEWEIAAE